MNKRAVKGNSKAKFGFVNKDKNLAKFIMELNSRYWTDVLWLDRA